MTAHPYQNAYDTAINELTEIAAQFEQLRTRKALVENVVHALQPFFAAEAIVGNQNPGEMATPEQSLVSAVASSDPEPPEGYSFRDVPSPLPDLDETGGDPFQRRVKTSFRFRGLAAQRSF